MDLRQLESFVRVAELGSFTRASASHDVPQPSLSRHVRQLEVELREHLLLRTGRGVELTDAGACLLGYGHAILELTRRAREDLQALRGKLTGRVTVGLPPRVAHVLTPVLVRRFRALYPDASISVAEGLSAALREELMLGRIEIALLFDPPHSPKLEVLSLFREDLVLCGRPRPGLPLPTRVAAHALPRYPVVVPRVPNGIRTLLDAACRAKGIELNIVAEVDAVQSQLELAHDGQGFAIVPHSAAAAPTAPDVRVTRIESPRIRNNLVLAFSKQRPLSRLGLATWDLLRSLDLGGLLAGGGLTPRARRR